MKKTEFEKMILEALGLEGQNVINLTLKLSHNRWPVVEAELFVEDFKGVDFPTVMRNYVVAPVGGPPDGNV